MEVIYDRKDVERTLSIFCGGNGIAEIRIPHAFGVKGRNDSGYFDHFPMAAGVLQPYAMSPKTSSIYFVLNPFAPELLARAVNRFQERASETTQDSDIIRRHWLFIDCDPCRKAGISSSDKEFQAAEDRVKAVAKWLQEEMQFPEPIVACSGNGYHLHFRIDAPADAESATLIKSCLRAIATKFDDDVVKIDTKVFNASRICKLYGTMARKGDHTPDRPHRLSRLIHVPDALKEVSPDQLTALAALAPPETKHDPAKIRRNRGPKKSTLDRAAAYLKKVPGAISGQGGHDWTFHAACLLVIEFSLSVEDAFPLLKDWNECCEPPWSDHELMHKLEDADKLSDERGGALKSDRQRWEEEQQERILSKAKAVESSSEGAIKVDLFAYDRKILTECGITYVAQHDDSGHIEIFSSETQKFTTIRDPSAIKFEQMLLSCGQPFRNRVRPNDQGSGQYSMSEFKAAIAAIASENSAINDKLGVGIWENRDSIVVVNARKMGILNGKPDLDLTSTPVYCGVAYDIGDRCDWIDLDSLKRDVLSVQAKAGVLYRSEIHQVRDLFAKWQYLAPNHVFPEILCGMVLATFTQTMWAWRPQIFLTGQAYTGKSTMFKMIAAIFGSLCKMSSNSSAAGLRQFLAHSGRIVLCDELEASHHRKDILEMIRASGRGDESFRGTAGHQYRGFRLQHMFWCASTESGLQTEADQSRFIITELKKVDARIDLPSIDELTRLGHRMAAAAICSFRRARQLVTYLMDNKPQDVHGRICESYSVPCSMYAAAIGMNEPEALELFHAAIASIGEAADIESDSESLLSEIMFAKVRTGSHGEKTVADMIRDRFNLQEHEQELRTVGIYIADGEIYINCRSAVKYLLSSEWKGKRIDTLLLRLPGSHRATKRFGKTVLRFIVIPRNLIPSFMELNGSEVGTPDGPLRKTFEQEAMSDGLFSSV